MILYFCTLENLKNNGKKYLKSLFCSVGIIISALFIVLLTPFFMVIAIQKNKQFSLRKKVIFWTGLIVSGLFMWIDGDPKYCILLLCVVLSFGEAIKSDKMDASLPSEESEGQGSTTLKIFTFVFVICMSLVNAVMVAGSVGVAWVVAVVARIATIGESPVKWTGVFRRTLSAILIGLTPQAVMLIYVNGILPGSVFLQSEGSRSAYLFYEQKIFQIQDTIGDYLLPPFIIGVCVALVLFVVQKIFAYTRFMHAVARLQAKLRFAGLILAAATTFTLATSVPVQAWQPNARLLFKAHLAKLLEQQINLALVEKALVDSRSDSWTLRPAVQSAATMLTALPPDLQEAAIRTLVKQCADQDLSHQPDNPGSADRLDERLMAISRHEARVRDKTAQSELHKTESTLSGEAQLLADTLASSAGSLAQPFIKTLLAALFEDAAHHMADNVLHSATTEQIRQFLARSGFIMPPLPLYGRHIEPMFRKTTAFLANSLLIRKVMTDVQDAARQQKEMEHEKRIEEQTERIRTFER
jgi:hypothetical protein